MELKCAGQPLTGVLIKVVMHAETDQSAESLLSQGNSTPCLTSRQLFFIAMRRPGRANGTCCSVHSRTRRTLCCIAWDAKTLAGPLTIAHELRDGGERLQRFRPGR